MIYYQGYTVSFQEVPDEISLVILIGDCPCRCPGCHSPELQRKEGKDLETDFDSLIGEYGDVISCVCFMGTGQDYPALFRLLGRAKDYGYKTCVYSGHYSFLANGVDYIKIGPYIERLGGLDSPTTNQRMLKEIAPSKYVDITWRFQKKENLGIDMCE